MSEAGTVNHPNHTFGAVLYPHRSLKPAHFSKLLLGLIAICTVVSLRFIAVGAWPVSIFLGADILALWFAFYLNYRSARAHEIVQLSDKNLTVERVSANGTRESWSFEPYWVSLELKSDKHYGNRLELSLHHQHVMLGQFLSAHERKGLHKALAAALHCWRNRQPLPIN